MHQYAVPFALLLIIVVAATLWARPRIRRVHSVTLENGAVVVETSSDGRPANPYRTHTYIPLARSVIHVSAALLVLIAVAAAVFWGFARP